MLSHIPILIIQVLYDGIFSYFVYEKINFEMALTQNANYFL